MAVRKLIERIIEGMKRTIYITDYDLKRLRKLLDAGPARFPMDVQHLKTMKEELDRAIVVSPEDIPPDVITMNSRVHLTNVATGESEVLSLVFPADANVDESRISILAPVGTAMLGYRVGDIIDWKVPGGSVQLRVDDVLYQPEAAGNFYE